MRSFTVIQEGLNKIRLHENITNSKGKSVLRGSLIKWSTLEQGPNIDDEVKQHRSKKGSHLLHDPNLGPRGLKIVAMENLE